MKLKYLVAPLLFAAAAATGCQESAETYPAIYMTDAQNNPDKSMTIDEPPAETSITVSSSVVMEHDVRIQLEVRPELLAAYNDKYGKNYQIPPEESYALSSTETTILAGYNTSSAIDFTVSSVSEFAEGVTYCVPVGIKTVSGGISVLEPSRTLFIVLKMPVISKAIYLGSGNIYDVPSFQENSDLAALPQLTLEARVYMLGFQSRDPYISSIMGIEGKFLVRIGDSGVDPNQIQVASSRNLTNSDLKLDAGRWYHVAVTFESGNVKVYLDGAEKCSGNVGTSSVNFGVAHSDESDGKPRCFWIGYSYASDRYFDGQISEVRIWNKALTPEEINAPDHFYQVAAASDGLVAYWKFDEGAGKTIKDQTSYGNDLTVEKELKWVNVSLPELGK